MRYLGISLLALGLVACDGFQLGITTDNLDEPNDGSAGSTGSGGYGAGDNAGSGGYGAANEYGTGGYAAAGYGGELGYAGGYAEGGAGAGCGGGDGGMGRDCSNAACDEEARCYEAYERCVIGTTAGMAGSGAGGMAGGGGATTDNCGCEDILLECASLSERCQHDPAPPDCAVDVDTCYLLLGLECREPSDDQAALACEEQLGMCEALANDCYGVPLEPLPCEAALQCELEAEQACAGDDPEFCASYKEHCAKVAASCELPPPGEPCNPECWANYDACVAEQGETEECALVAEQCSNEMCAQ